MSEQKYSVDEVTRHNHADDLWMALHGKVYDMTKFLKEHPGGEEVLLNLAGSDGTKCFDEIGHSQEAKQLKDTLEIGELVGSFPEESNSAGKREATLDDDDDWTYEAPKKQSSPYLPIFIAFGVVVYAAIFYYLF
ncbi:cytochrome b5-like [Copidosoma floridanum]|uniref:cytochrome b5-like n=1 Tax=Copidosoma floridanum TaxID=29053 RepID=UPI0006C9E5E4|nr:cytochrome b5-like [Copidosoma floridanum]